MRKETLLITEKEKVKGTKEELSEGNLREKEKKKAKIKPETSFLPPNRKD